jgi:hypothetical protein
VGIPFAILRAVSRLIRSLFRFLNLFAVGPAVFDVDKAWSSIFADSFPTSVSWEYRGRFTN